MGVVQDTTCRAYCEDEENPQHVLGECTALVRAKLRHKVYQNVNNIVIYFSLLLCYIAGFDSQHC